MSGKIEAVEANQYLRGLPNPRLAKPVDITELWAALAAISHTG